MLPAKQNNNKTALQVVMAEAKLDWLMVGFTSFAINSLMLTGPLFMLQVYDRVLTSRSIPTLLVLYGLIVVLFGFLGLFSFFRTRILSRLSMRLDSTLMSLAQKYTIVSNLDKGVVKVRPLADLSRLRQFLASNGTTAFFDLPWSPIFVAVVFYMHPALGLLTIVGIVIITIFTLINEHLTRDKILESTRWDVKSSGFSDSTIKSAESIISMGMMDRILNRWEQLRKNSLSEHQQAGKTSEVLMSMSRALRLLLQSSILGLGAYLAVQQIITPGMMIAASIIGGRALSPIDQVIGNWRNFTGARQSYARLNTVFANINTDALTPVDLPSPQGKLDVNNITKFNPVQPNELPPILQGISFSLNPGAGLGIIGPSASGKTSLAKMIMGIWRADRGEIRLDGADFEQWDRVKLGNHIGYLPQNAEIIDGTVKENISRFMPDVEDSDVLSAAKMADVHDLILSFPGGYNARIGEEVILSAGQTQRILLARALYKTPALIVLDEPNSNLDAEGDAALTRAIKTAREAGSTVIVIAHRPSAITSLDQLLMLRQGQQIDFGVKQEVLKRITQAANTSNASQNAVVSVNKG